VAVPERDKLEYGGNTSCVEVRLDDGKVLVFDAGTGIRALGKKLVAEADSERELNEVVLFLTHAHMDHLSGFPFFAPLYADKWLIKVRGGPIAKETLKGYLGRTMSVPYFPVGLGTVAANLDFTSGLPSTRRIGGASVEPIPLNHPGGGFGFRVVENGNTFVYIPDNELDGEDHEDGESYYDYVKFCEGADLVFHDAQYTPKEFEFRKGWGHSTFLSATELAIAAKASRLGLFHHDPERSRRQYWQDRRNLPAPRSEQELGSRGAARAGGLGDRGLARRPFSLYARAVVVSWLM
jgi:phosphoribosyl 1,2-cyclic phosphodiesterase